MNQRGTHEKILKKGEKGPEKVKVEINGKSNVRIRDKEMKQKIRYGRRIKRICVKGNKEKLDTNGKWRRRKC